jgi:hypothetical protein
MRLELWRGVLRGDFGSRISDFGLRISKPWIRHQSAIRNPQSMICRLLAIAIAYAGLTASIAHAVDLRVATFQADVTPPPGSPLCDALVPPASGVNDPLSARGIVIQADNQKPVVLVAVDWVGIGNEGQDAWRQAIAEACRTSVDRVCVHTLHQHDAPGCDFLAERIADEAGLAGQIFPVEYARDAIRRVAAEAAEAQGRAEQVTHIGYGKALVEKVASSRRILGPDGKVMFERMSSCKDPAGRELPEGLIDPNVRMLTLWNSEQPIAVLTYYATHPQSYYYTGKCSADFVGMARDQAQAAEKTPLHIHFNGAGGNVAAGKYNDGSHEMRPILAGRLAAGMKQAWNDSQKLPVADVAFDWATRDVKLPQTEAYDDNEERAMLDNTNAKLLPRLRAARNIAWAKRATAGPPITIGRLRLGPIDILHMPGELFVEYQLAAQTMRPESFVCMAAYGDYGPGYIGTAIAYTQGGYETGPVSRVSPRAEPVLMDAMRKLLK